MINDIKARLAAARDFIYDNFGSSMQQDVGYFSTRKVIRKLYADCQSLLSEIDRLKKYERGIGAPTRRLLDEIDRLTSENESLRTERDAAVDGLRGNCLHCKNDEICVTRKGSHQNCWKWRGPQPKQEG